MKIPYMGWKHDPVTNVDKVWGVIELIQGNENWLNWPKLGPATDFVYAVVWGRRGQKLRHQIVNSPVELRWIQGPVQYEDGNWFPRGIGEKANKKYFDGYIPIENKLSEVYPEFEEDLSKTAVWAMLGL